MPRQYRYLLLINDVLASVPKAQIIECNGLVERDERATQIFNSQGDYGKDYPFSQEKDLILALDSPIALYELHLKAYDKNNLVSEEDEDDGEDDPTEKAPEQATNGARIELMVNGLRNPYRLVPRVRIRNCLGRNTSYHRFESTDLSYEYECTHCAAVILFNTDGLISSYSVG